jgi:hypothetical protein
MVPSAVGAIDTSFILLLQKQQEVETGEGSKRGDSDMGMACRL